MSERPGSECRSCKGSGETQAMTQHLGPDDYTVTVACPACKGTGECDHDWRYHHGVVSDGDDGSGYECRTCGERLATIWKAEREAYDDHLFMQGGVLPDGTEI